METLVTNNELITPFDTINGVKVIKYESNRMNSANICICSICSIVLGVVCAQILEFLRVFAQGETWGTVFGSLVSVGVYVGIKIICDVPSFSECYTLRFADELSNETLSKIKEQYHLKQGDGHGVWLATPKRNRRKNKENTDA